MIQIKIDIAGPGLVISNETYLVKEVLQDHGYEVEVIDKHPPKKKPNIHSISGKNVKVIIETHHAPWGG